MCTQRVIHETVFNKERRAKRWYRAGFWVFMAVAAIQVLVC
jgi:hypothetical protein